ncbi:hemerythrin domain-containing protein [Caminibacter pacificus]
MLKSIRKTLRSKKNKYHKRDLVKKLQKDHQKLLKLFLSLEEAINKKSPSAIKKLQKFIDELELHLTLENSQFYAHLESKYRFCNLKIMQEIKEEIPKNAPLFLQLKKSLEEKKYIEAQAILNTIRTFLFKRIKFEEEKLYKIYDKIYKCNEVYLLLR